MNNFSYKKEQLKTLLPGRNIRVKFILWIILILTFMVATAAFYSAGAQKELLNQSLQKKAKALGEFVSLVSPQAIYGYDFTTLDQFSRQIFSNHDIFYCVIIDNSNKPLTTALPEGVNFPDTGFSLMEKFTWLKNQPGIQQLSFPIMNNEKQLGQVLIGIDTRPMLEAAKDVLYKQIVIFLIALILLIIFIFIVFSHSVIRPVKALVAGANNVSRGIYDQPISVNSKDELGELTRTFNLMMAEIHEDRELLTRQNASLIKFSRAVEQSPATVVMTDTRGNIEYVNDQFTLVSGYTETEVMGQNTRIFQSGLHEKSFYQKLWDTITRGNIWRGQMQNRKKNGEIYWEYATIQGITNEAGEIFSYIAIKEDITEQKRAEDALRKSEARNRLILNSSTDGIFGIDAQGRTTFVNQAAARMFGYTVKELTGRVIHDLIHHTRKDGTPYSKSDCKMLDSAQNGITHHVSDEVLWHREGHSFPVEYWSSPMEDHESGSGAVITFHDISQHKAAEEEIRQLAFHDPLTGLPNRLLFMERLQHNLLQLKRFGTSFAAMLLDLDHFKDINDALGHPVGDQLLIQASERLRQTVREVDTIARIGGDEFAIILEDINDYGTAASLAQQFIDNIAQPFHIKDNHLQLGTSVGIVLVNDSKTAEEDVLVQADIALYKAKEQGRGKFVFYKDVMSNKLQTELKLINDLPKAMENNELFLVFQPQVSLQTGKISGAESLLRWTHPVLGVIPPSVFIAVIEKRGLIELLGKWIMKQACRQILDWQAKGFQLERVSVNLSALQLRNVQSLQDLIDIIEAHGIDFRRIEFELTESVLIKLNPKVQSLIEETAKKGIHYAIDDFGTGYSSLAYLKRIKANKLKIDQEFIQDMLDDPSDLEIVKATIALAHALGMEIIAEGVETSEQLALLKELNCDAAQGYYYSRPVEPDTFYDKYHSQLAPCEICGS
jgi:diguanylate cyclase (GGDEF)-like protein/PAS domain S-box-containing protein